MADTIEIRLAMAEVEADGGDLSWKRALGLANVGAVNQGWPVLPSQRYGDCAIVIDPLTQEYVFTFGPSRSLDFSVAAKSGYVPVIGL